MLQCYPLHHHATCAWMLQSMYSISAHVTVYLWRQNLTFWSNASTHPWVHVYPGVQVPPLVPWGPAFQNTPAVLDNLLSQDVPSTHAQEGLYLPSHLYCPDNLGNTDILITLTPQTSKTCIITFVTLTLETQCHKSFIVIFVKERS